MKGSLLLSKRTVPWLALLAFSWQAWGQETTVALEMGVSRTGAPALVATVVDGDGKAVTNAAVEFYLIPEFFPNYGTRLRGSNPILLGSGRTNVAGRAEREFTPFFTGNMALEARLVDGSRTVATGRLEGDFERAVDPRREFEVPLAAVRAPLGNAVIALTALIWLFLLVLVLSTLRNIRMEGRREAADTRLAHRGV